MKRTVTKRSLGKHGPTVSSIGLGAMGMSDLYGKADRAESVATIRAALDAGINVIDTGDFYGSGHNELLIREALAGRTRESVVLSIKFGELRDPAGGWGGTDNRPAALKSFLAQSLQRVGHGLRRHLSACTAGPERAYRRYGRCNVRNGEGWVRPLHRPVGSIGADDPKAHAIHPIADLQIEYSLISRGIEKDILPTLRELGIGLTAYGVLSRGLISGHWSKAREGDGDFRSINPRFQGKNLDKNLSSSKNCAKRRAPRV
jgi:aryl-alcohol dehydrogenase-like predicted oxidoreductase